MSLFLASGVTVAAPVVATAASAAVAYKYGVTPALVLSGTGAAVSTGVAAVVKGGKVTFKGLRYVATLGAYAFNDDDDDD